MDAKPRACDWYVPPRFAIAEWGDDEPADRWLADWQGLVGRPAHDVTLGWRGHRSQTTTFVSTLGPQARSEEDLRLEVMRIALLSGSFNLGPGRALLPSDLTEAANAVAWTSATVSLDGSDVDGLVTRGLGLACAGYYKPNNDAGIIVVWNDRSVIPVLKRLTPRSAELYSPNPLAALRHPVPLAPTGRSASE